MHTNRNEQKVAIIHDWLLGMRGGEKVLEALLELYPNATIYTLLHKKGSVSKRIEERPIITSFINKLPFPYRLYQYYNPLFPFAIEQFDLQGYDLVISSSHNAAKGVITGPETRHISYIHTPVRYYWDQYHQYFHTWPLWKKIAIGFVATFYRTWDISNTKRIDVLIANSYFVASRIKKYYKEEAMVIYPAVDTERFSKIAHKSDDYYLVVCALAYYKGIEIAVKAFNLNGKKLMIIGKGDMEKSLKEQAKSNITFLGWVEDKNLGDYYAHAKGFIINAIEDFGIAPVEAQAAGVPVIAYRKGGVLESVIENETGVFYDEQHEDSLNEAINRFEQMQFDEEKIREQSRKFSKKQFKNAFLELASNT